MQETSYWRLESAFTFASLGQQLPRDLNLQQQPEQRRTLTLLDDFDWRIWQQDMVLVREGSGPLALYDARGDCLASADAPESCRFWWQLPAGELAERLRPVVALRAFMPRFRCALHSRDAALENPDGKTVARLRIFQVVPSEGSPANLARLKALRGYGEEYDRAVLALQAAGARLLPELSCGAMFRQAGLEVRIPDSKSAFGIEDDEPAESAVTRMAAKMVQRARHQEQGLVEDIDTEFVHQYRVNLRKTRSLLSLFKKVLSTERRQQLRKDLKTLASATNELRDLDVFLLDHDTYAGLLPDELQPGLDKLFARIRRRRGTVFRQVRTWLTGEHYLELVSRVLRTLQDPPELDTDQGRQGIRTLAGDKIARQYRRVCRDGAQITDETPDAAVHELRIDCKKLRYLLELFSELFPRKDIKRLIKRLKKLQDNLGRFNDLSVQREFLLQQAGDARLSNEERASIHGLVAILYNQQCDERSRVMNNIAAFNEQGVAETVRALFRNPSRKDASR